MAITGLSDLGDTIPTIIEEAQFSRQFNAVMRGLCWNAKKGKGSTWNVPYWSDVTAAQLFERVDMTNSETMVDTNVQITPYEVGLKIILTDNVVEDDNEDVIRAAGKLIGSAYERKVDVDLLGQLDDAASSLGAANSSLTMGVIAAARATLMGNALTSGGPAPLPYVCVIHPFQELDIVDVLTPLVPAAGTTQSAAGAMADDVLRNYQVARLFGVPIVTDGNLPIDSSDDTKGGMFATGRGGGVVYVSAREPSVKAERDESLRGTELNYVGRYGVGEYRAGYIAEIYADASAPA